MIKASKRVRFADQQTTLENRTMGEVLKENQILSQRVLELEEFNSKSQMCLSKYEDSLEFMKTLMEKVEELKYVNENNTKRIGILESENSQILKENEKLRNENFELRSKKMILENEVEKLSQTVYNKEIQIKKMNLAKNTQAINPNYKFSHRVEKSSELIDTKVVSKLPLSAVYSRPKRKRCEQPVGKIKSSSIQPMSCKNLGTRSFSFSQNENTNKAEGNTLSLEDLKRLIEQAKERHYRNKSANY